MKWERLVFESATGLTLTGMLAEGTGGTTVIHVHGACGNYFSAGYIEALAAACTSAGVSVLTINTSGHDCIAEGFRRDTYEYVGGSVSLFEECVSDIEGAIRVAKGFSKRLILVGHSLGCDRIVFHALTTHANYPLVLISPCDSYSLHKRYLKGKSVEEHLEQLRRIQVVDKFSLLPMKEYGIDNKGDSYFIPVSRDTLLSIAGGPPFHQFRLDAPAPFWLANPCLVCIGGRDTLQTSTSAEMFAYMSEHFEDCTHYLAPEGDHEFAGSELELAHAIIGWISGSSA